ncbi:MAG: hypothetical protein EON54_28970 [Alcaligenaceae bacterium]|nr:MAG: hypothetical protein EON54_28970 [Alcaligenaceae bacterium]
MSRMTWDAVLHSAMAMPEGRHMRIRWCTNTLLLERRGEVLIAMREISRNQLDSAVPGQAPDASEPNNRQLLAIGEAYYVCDWRRQPEDAHWIAGLASACL